MHYHSTRNEKKEYSASRAILDGLASDGGLFVPNELPDFSVMLKELQGLSYQELCLKVVTAYFTEFSKDKQLAADIAAAFDKFFSPTVLEIAKAGNYFAELSHGDRKSVV